MKLRNGADEEKAVIMQVLASLVDLQGEYGHTGLIAALRVAKGATPSSLTRDMMLNYGLIKKSLGMSQSVKNVIESAVTAKGELQSPYK